MSARFLLQKKAWRNNARQSAYSSCDLKRRSGISVSSIDCKSRSNTRSKDQNFKKPKPTRLSLYDLFYFPLISHLSRKSSLSGIYFILFLSCSCLFLWLWIDLPGLSSRWPLKHIILVKAAQYERWHISSWNVDLYNNRMFCFLVVRLLLCCCYGVQGGC